jgi:hypothetical protein
MLTTLRRMARRLRLRPGMGIRIQSENEDDARLTHRVDRVRLHVEQTVAKLAEVVRSIPEPDTVRRALTNAGADVWHELSNSCTSLELALADTLKWANRIAATTGSKEECGVRARSSAASG